jgi:DDE superfamily endonuclease
MADHLDSGAIAKPGGRPSALSLTGSVDLVCCLLRTNLSQEQVAEIFQVSQATASRRWDRLREPIASALATLVLTVRQIVGRDGSVLVDGFLAPTWDWRNVPDMFCAKHDHAGFTIQVGSAISGDLAPVGEPVPGARHDAHAFHASGLAELLTGHDTLGDKGYQAHTTIHPVRKPPGSNLSTHDKEYNHSVSSIRPAVERANSHLQNWKIIATPFRPPPSKFPATLRAVVGLYFPKKAFE